MNAADYGIEQSGEHFVERGFAGFVDFDGELVRADFDCCFGGNDDGAVERGFDQIVSLGWIL